MRQSLLYPQPNHPETQEEWIPMCHHLILRDFRRTKRISSKVMFPNVKESVTINKASAIKKCTARSCPSTTVVLRTGIYNPHTISETNTNRSESNLFGMNILSSSHVNFKNKNLESRDRSHRRRAAPLKIVQMWHRTKLRRTRQQRKKTLPSHFCKYYLSLSKKLIST